MEATVVRTPLKEIHDNQKIRDDLSETGNNGTESPEYSRQSSEAGIHIVCGDTDQTDNTEEDTVSSLQSLSPYCTHEHLELIVIDEVFDLSVDSLFEMVFMNHPMYRKFHRVKKSANLVVNDWSVPDETGDRTRTITYTIAITHSVLVKSGETTEKQFIRSGTKPGVSYLVDSHCQTLRVPYGDYFHLLIRFCMTKVSTNRSRFIISSNLVYTKKCWGLVKAFIEKNVRFGTRESYTLLAQLLHEESEQQNFPADQKERKKILTKRRPDRSLSPPSSRSPSPPGRSPGIISDGVQGHINADTFLSIHPHRTTRRTRLPRCSRTNPSAQFWFRLNSETLVKFVLCLLLLLTIIHSVLFYKLRDVEERAGLLLGNQPQPQLADRSPADHELEKEWILLIQKQEQLHKVELDKWHNLLSSSANLMANMQQTLVSLETNIHQETIHKRHHPDH